MNTPSLRAAKSNRLLAALPRAALERIIPDLHQKPLAMGQVLQPRGEPLEEVVFPLLGVASMISMGDSGDSVEVATIGCEGIVGLPLFLGGRKRPSRYSCRCPAKVCTWRPPSFTVT